MDDRERNDQAGTSQAAESTGDAPKDMGPDTARAKTVGTPGGIPQKGDIGVHGAAEGELDKAKPGSEAQRDAASGAEKAWPDSK